MWDYFIKKNLTHSVGAFFAYIVIYFAAMQMGETGVFTMFISGYCSDSMVNKAIEERD
jgi:NhaP-type Na+/H+ or K+/H+ antiporter